jgi:hypothetical protein
MLNPSLLSGDQPDADRITPRHQPIAIVLDLVNPLWAGRRAIGRGWQAGFYEAGRNRAGTRRHTGQDGCSNAAARGLS